MTTIVWNPASESPSTDRLVIVAGAGKAKLMYYDAACRAWRGPDMIRQEPPSWWCEFPEAPKKDPND